MIYLYVKQKIEDFDRWYQVFKSHKDSQLKAGLKNLKLLKVMDEPNTIICLFEVGNIESARAFTNAPQISDIRNEAGVVGMPEVLFLEEF